MSNDSESWGSMSVMSVIEIAAGIAVGILVYDYTGVLLHALIWCAVISSVIGRINGQQ